MEDAMSDDHQNRNAPDNQRLNLNQEHEVRYWTEKFKVSIEDLRKAIEAVGPVASAVEQRLRRH